jgi:hypothetical protein
VRRHQVERPKFSGSSTGNDGVGWDDLDLAKLEAEVFTGVGVWKNFDELEESLTLKELMASVDALRESQKHLVRAIFGAQGVDIDADSGGPRTIEDVRLEALGLRNNDIATQTGALAEQEGFGIGLGLGYEVEVVSS